MERIERHRSDESRRNAEMVTTRSNRVKEKKEARSGRCNSWSNDHTAANQRKEHTVKVMKRSKKSSKVSIKSWWNDPEMKRKRRVASYKFYGAQGNLKKSFRWFKTKCTMIVHRFS